LTSTELVELYEVATTTGDDTELDSLILQFVRQTAARRGGVISARVGGLDVTRGAVTLTEKGGIAREVPCGRALQSRLENFARARGAQGASDHVFRYSNGTPLSRRRFNSLFDRIDRHTDWTEQLDVGIHWIRHTTLTDIALVADMRVAAASAGHSFDDGPVTLRYTKPTFEELIAAHDAVFPEAAIAVSPSDR
jgi:site-specific recombinase XerD